MDLLTTDTRSDRVARADAPLATAPKGTRRRSAPTQAGTPDSAAPDTGPDPRRMTLARAIVQLFSSTIPASSGLRIEFQDGRAGVPVMGDPPRATLRILGPGT
jgi:hypothetical protein